VTDSDRKPDTGLNPALRQRRETLHDAEPTPPPAESASVQKEEGRAWPAIWLVVTVLCAVIAIFLIFF
jgi:hypothetical protein